MAVLDKNFKLNDSVGYLVNIVANRMKVELETLFTSHNHDISAMQWMVLSIACENNGISQNELSKKSKKDKTNIARIIEKLEKKELIERRRSVDDKRFFGVFVTEKGNVLRSELSVLAAQVVENSLIGISQEEHEVCLKVLKKIYINLK